MGKVTIIVETEELTSSELEAHIHQLIDDDEWLEEIPGNPVEIFVVPADED